MGSMNVVMRSPGAEGGSPNNSEMAGARPAAQPDAGLDALQTPAKPQVKVSAIHTESKPALSLAPENGKTSEILTSASRPPSPKPEYFTDRDEKNSPLVRLLADIRDKFSKGEVAGGVARAVVAAPLVVGRFASGLMEVSGIAVTIGAALIIPELIMNGSSPLMVIGLGVAGPLINQVGVLGWHLIQRGCHNVRGLFGDTKATFEQSLPSHCRKKGGYKEPGKVQVTGE